MTISGSLLEVTDLSCHFPVGDGAFLHAVDGVSFGLEAGASLGVVGESGSGKSTLVRLVTRAIDLTAGSIRFAGMEIGATSFERFARSPMRGRIQMVFQDPTDSLNPRWSAGDAIADPIRRLKVVAGRKAVQARVAELAALVDLPEALLGRYPHQLSGGQKARVGIARALATNPDLLVLDEPTSALDVSVQAVILKLLASLRRKLGIAYLFVSHDLDVIRLLCERVMVMYMGTIVEQGVVDAIFARPAHPYTKALVAAVSPDTAFGLDGVLGEPGSPIDPPADACRFMDACPIAQPVCGTSRPPLRMITADQAAACHFAP